ncbi:hypothetical protein C8R44DRAFT_211686 [Mycena epipterygia]|nr:hypothetical protein C8R44DRAFT_211686 [Mycena epipterygia]
MMTLEIPLISSSFSVFIRLPGSVAGACLWTSCCRLSHYPQISMHCDWSTQRHNSYMASALVYHPSRDAPPDRSPRHIGRLQCSRYREDFDIIFPGPRYERTAISMPPPSSKTSNSTGSLVIPEESPMLYFPSSSPIASKLDRTAQRGRSCAREGRSQVVEVAHSSRLLDAR